MNSEKIEQCYDVIATNIFAMVRSDNARDRALLAQGIFKVMAEMFDEIGKGITELGK